MRIAVELNNIIRDYNTQVLKYYLKDYDPSYDDENVDLNCSNLLDKLPFKSKKEKKTFKEIDYPYELFGCAKTMHKHLHVDATEWLENNDDIELIYFSLDEGKLNIQSTYFFLSKGSRTRTMIFPKKAQDIWDWCDVAVTLNKDVLMSTPWDKKSILIKKSDNKKLEKYADLVYNSFDEIIKDPNFKDKLNGRELDSNKTSKNKILDKLKKMTVWMKAR